MVVAQADTERWKRLALKTLAELDLIVGHREDDLSARRIAIVVGESWAKIFDGKMEINKLTATVATLEYEMYGLLRKTRLHCEPLEREEPPASWKARTKSWRRSQLKIVNLGGLLGECGRKLTAEFLELVVEGGEKRDENRGSDNRKRVVRRAKLHKRTDKRLAKTRTALHQPGKSRKAV